MTRSRMRRIDRVERLYALNRADNLFRELDETCDQLRLEYAPRARAGRPALAVVAFFWLPPAGKRGDN
jgi:hypothetical protein